MIAGSGDLRAASLSSNHLHIGLPGPGDVAVNHLKAETVTADINGPGNGQVWADGSLAVDINGSGGVGYRGGAKLNKSINGSGEVHPLDRKDG